MTRIWGPCTAAAAVLYCCCCVQRRGGYITLHTRHTYAAGTPDTLKHEASMLSRAPFNGARTLPSTAHATARCGMMHLRSWSPQQHRRTATCRWAAHGTQITVPPQTSGCLPCPRQLRTTTWVYSVSIPSLRVSQWMPDQVSVYKRPRIH